MCVCVTALGAVLWLPVEHPEQHVHDDGEHDAYHDHRHEGDVAAPVLVGDTQVPGQRAESEPTAELHDDARSGEREPSDDDQLPDSLQVHGPDLSTRRPVLAACA